MRETADNLVCGYHLALLRPFKQKMDGAFLFRCLQAKPVRMQLELAANGVTRFGIPKSEIGTMRVPVPPVAQQRAVADCQFIATTHSPQVIGEVEHDLIQIIADGEVYSPTHSFGVDSSRVLEEVMDAPPRTSAVEDLLTKVSQEVGKQRLEQARKLLAQLVDRLGENDPDVTRITTLLDFVEGEE